MASSSSLPLPAARRPGSFLDQRENRLAARAAAKQHSEVEHLIASHSTALSHFIWLVFVRL
jgi:hypothetical protein